MKILFISSIPPVPTWGSAMTFYRHFCERNDFTISVITNDQHLSKFKVPYRYLIIDNSRTWKRVARTRFYMIPHTGSMLVGSLFIPDQVMKFAKAFEPDAIFTMAGSWTWMAILAQKVAKKLNVPLIGSFNDWWYYNTIYHSKFHHAIESRFRKFYKECDLAICTSEGMQKELGQHPNSVIIYPTGALIGSVNKKQAKNKVFTVAFGGNLGEWYGRMMESLVVAAKGLDIEFKIFGGNPSWSEAFDADVKEKGIYKGQIKFEELQQEMQEVDGLLLLMGFDESSKLVEATSFKTKFLDYLSFQKPILVWGPDYCSAVVNATEFNSAEICTSSAAVDFVNTIMRVKNDPFRQAQLVTNAYRMYQERFNPDKIHALLKNKLYAFKSIKTAAV